MARDQDITVKMLGDAQSFIRMLEDSEKALTSTVGQIEKTVSQIENYGAGLVNFAEKVVKTITSMHLTQEFSKFNKSITESTSIMIDVTDEQVAQMEKAAKELSINHPKAAHELGKGYYSLASAGWNAEQALAALPGVARFATAGVFELARATELAVSAQSALGMRAKDPTENLKNLTRVTDVLIRANVLAQASTEQFSVALSNQAGAEAKVAGKSIEEVVAVLAAFADQGIRGQKAGTSFGRVIRLLSKTAVTPKYRQAQKALGFNVFEEGTGEMRNIADIIQNLEQVLKPMSTELQKATLLSFGFSATVQQSLLPLIGTSEEIRRFQKELEAAGGVTKDITQKQLQAFVNQMKTLKNLFGVVMIEIGQIYAPMILLVADAVRGLLMQWRALDQDTQKFILTAVTVFGVLSQLRVIILLVGLALKVAFNPFLYIGAALSIAITFLITNFERFKEIITEIAGAMGIDLSFVNRAFSGLKELWDDLINGGRGLISVLKMVWDSIPDIGDALRKVLRDIGSLMGYFKGLFSEIFDAVVSASIVTIFYLVEGLKKLSKALSTVIGWVIAFINEYREVVVAVGTGAILFVALSVAVGVVVIALKSAIFVISALTSILGINKLITVVTTLAWLAWAAVMFAVKVVMISLGLVFAAFKFIWAAWSLAVAIATAVTAGFNVQITGTTILTLGLAGAIYGALLYAFLSIIAAVMALIKVGTLLRGVLRNIATDTGPLAAISSMFAEWGNMLGVIMRAMKVDMKLAWEMVGLAAKIAISQIRDLWAPLWEYIKSGFQNLAKLVSASFSVAFNESLQSLAIGLLNLPKAVLSAMFGIQVPGLLTKYMKKLKDDSAKKMESMANDTNKAMKNAEDKFNNDFKVSDRTRKLQDEFKILTKRLEDAENAQAWMKIVPDDLLSWFGMPSIKQLMDGTITPQAPDVAKAADAWKNIGKEIGEQFTGGMKQSVQKFDSVLLRSAEAARRYQAYIDTLNLGESKEARDRRQAPPLPRFDPLAAARTGPIARDSDWLKEREPMVRILGDIREILRRRPGVNLEVIDLEE